MWGRVFPKTIVRQPKRKELVFMNSRIGRKLLLAIIICIVLTVLAVSAVTLARASSQNDSLMGTMSDTGVRILQRRVNNHITRVKDVLDFMDISDAVTQSSEDIADAFNERKELEGDFAAFFRPDGTIYWKSDNYDIADLDIGKIPNDGFSGILDDSRGGLTVQATKKIYRDGTLIGAGIVGLHLSDYAWLDEIKDETNSEVTIFSGKTRYATTVTDSDGKRAVGTDMADNVAKAVIEKGDVYSGTADILGQKHYVHYEPMLDVNGKVVGAYFSGLSAKESDQLMASMRITNVIVAVVVAGISLAVLSVIAVKMIINPIKAAEKLAKKMNQGILKVERTELKFANDELGDFVRTLENTTENLSSYVNDIGNVLSKMGTGDFSAEPEVEYIGDFSEIKVSFQKIKSELRGIIGNINQASREVMDGSTTIHDGSQALADGTTRQAAAIEQLSANITEITAKVHQSAQNASEAGSISSETSEKIRMQNGEIDNMLGAMNEIKEKSDKIQNIIQAIDDIAFQTNILALNAAIEAARAGEAGKGFAVVADEVRNLAAKSADSARQTGELINDTIEAVDKGTQIAQGTADTMKKVIELSDRTNQHIGDISRSAVEQKEAIDQIKTGVDQISEVVLQNSANAKQTATACSDLSSQAVNLKTQIDRLKV